MRKHKKLISICIAVLMFMMIFAGCNKDEKQQPTEAPETEKNETKAEEPVEEKSEEPVELSLYNVGQFPTELDLSILDTNPLGKKLEELTNVKMTIEYSTGQDGQEKLNLLLASGDYPDIVLLNSGEIISRMIDEEIAIPLDDLIEANGANIKEMYGDILNRLRHSDGNLYYLSSGYGYWEEGDPVPGFGNCFSMRQDAYEAIGSPKIETLDDIYDALVELDAIYDTDANGDKIFVLGGFSQTWQNMRDVLADGAGFYKAGRWYLDENGELKYWVRGPQALTITKFYNRVHTEELLDPEAFTVDRGTFNQNKLETGRVLSMFGGWWMNWTTHASFKEQGFENADNMAFIQFPFSVEGGQTPKFTEVNPIGGSMTVITDNCLNPEAAIKWLDTLASHDISFETQNGVEGVLWDMVDGKPVMKPEIVERFLAGAGDQEFSADAGSRIYHSYASKHNGMTNWGTRWILKDDPVVMGDERAAYRDEVLGQYWYDSSYFNNLFTESSDDIQNMYTMIDEKINQDYYTAVLAGSEAECEAEWYKYVEYLEELGLLEVEAEANRVYQSRIN